MDADIPIVTRGPGLVILCGVLGALTGLIVLARFWSRFILQKNAGVEEAVFDAAVPFVIGEIIATVLEVTRNKANRHTEDLTELEFVQIRKLGMVLCMCYVTSTCFIKISILTFYTRLTMATSRIVSRVLQALILSEVIYWVVCLVALCFPCHPMEAYYQKFNPAWAATHTFSCYAESPVLMSMAVISVLQDICIAVVPMALVWNLSLPKRQKLAVCATLGAGLLTCAAGLWRVWAIWNMYWGPTDEVWGVYIYWTACITEVLLACICASAPALKFYFDRYFDNNTAPVPDEKAAQLTHRGSVQRLLSVSGSAGDHSPPSSPFRPDFRRGSSALTTPSRSYSVSGKQKTVLVEEKELGQERQPSVVANMQILNVDQLIREGIVSSKFEHVHPSQIGSAPQWTASWE